MNGNTNNNKKPVQSIEVLELSDLPIKEVRFEGTIPRASREFFETIFPVHPKPTRFLASQALQFRLMHLQEMAQYFDSFVDISGCIPPRWSFSSSIDGSDVEMTSSTSSSSPSKQDEKKSDEIKTDEKIHH